MLQQDLLKLDPSMAGCDRFCEWVDGQSKPSKEGCGDLEALIKLRALIDSVPAAAQHAVSKRKPNESIKPNERATDANFKLREQVHLLRRLEKELVGRYRSLRYFQAIRSNQNESQESASVCVACEEPRGAAPWGILSCCGHQGYYKCLLAAAGAQECPAKGCAAAARVSSVINTSTLTAAPKSGANANRFGSKLESMLERIHSLPKDDRILVFVQFPDLAQAVVEALSGEGIGVAEVRGTVIQKTKVMDSMQEEGGPRVLLLNLADESASGANLTLCNHAIFVHPMLAHSQEHYTACETQAIGRIRRYGQNKVVHIWRYIVENTIDQKIFDERHRAWDDGMK